MGSASRNKTRSSQYPTKEDIQLDSQEPDTEAHRRAGGLQEEEAGMQGQGGDPEEELLQHELLKAILKSTEITDNIFLHFCAER